MINISSTRYLSRDCTRCACCSLELARRRTRVHVALVHAELMRKTSKVRVLVVVGRNLRFVSYFTFHVQGRLRCEQKSSRRTHTHGPRTERVTELGYAIRSETGREAVWANIYHMERVHVDRRATAGTVTRRTSWNETSRGFGDVFGWLSEVYWKPTRTW